jgi:peptide deformylase
MAQLSILTHHDARLRTPGTTVTAFDADLERLIADMTATMREHGIIGLSAQQVGDDRRVCVIDPAGDGSGVEVFVNPAILARWRTAIVDESCQSIPGVQGKVFRATRLRARAQDATGTEFIRDLEDMAAVALQHEVDHLDGKLFIDRLNPLRRLALALRQRWQGSGADRDQRARA